MKLKRLSKMLVCCVCTLCLVVADYNLGVIYAEDNQSVDIQGALEEYLEYEASQNTTGISEELEENLNQDGLFDSEVSRISDDVVDALENGAEYEISSGYGEIIEDENGNIDVKELTDSEIDEFIVEEYGEEFKTDKNILGRICLGKEEVQAANTKIEGDNHTVSTKFKHSMMISKSDKNSYYDISYFVTWSKAPTNMMKDLMGFSVDGAILADTKTVKASAWVTYADNKDKIFSCLDEMEYVPNKLGTRVLLNKYTRLVNREISFSRCIITLSGRYEKKKGASNILVYSEYQHQIRKISLNPTITFSSDNKTTFSLSAKVQEDMSKLLPNCYINWKL